MGEPTSFPPLPHDANRAGRPGGGTIRLSDKELTVPFTNYLDQALTKLLFSNTAYTIPATWYVALSTTTPTQGASPNFTEPSGNAYARVAVTNNSTNWQPISSQPASGYTMQNNTIVTFATATGTWGTVTYFGVFDASSGGNLCGYGLLTASQAITTGIAPSFAVGAL